MFTKLFEKNIYSFSETVKVIANTHEFNFEYVFFCLKRWKINFFFPSSKTFIEEYKEKKNAKLNCLDYNKEKTWETSAMHNTVPYICTSCEHIASVVECRNWNQWSNSATRRVYGPNRTLLDRYMQ